MGWRRTVLPLCAVVLVAACASSSRTTPAERLEWYRAHAGEPIGSFQTTGRLWGWRALGDSALTVWTRRDQGFLLDLADRCPDLPFATTIGLTTRGSRVSAGFDSVVVPQRGPPGNPAACRIRTIHPLNTRVVQEAETDLQDLDLVERDPSVPDEPR